MADHADEMTVNQKFNRYFILKRKIYLVVLPIMTVINLWYWLFATVRGPVIDLVLPVLVAYFIAAWVSFYFKYASGPCEWVGLGLSTLYHLGRIFIWPHTLADNTFNLYLAWAPLYYIYVFLVLPARAGLGFSLGVYLLTMGIGLPHYDQTPALAGVLTQYFASNAIYIAVLFFMQRLVTVYVETDVLRNLAYRDALTEIGNRRMVQRWIERELKRFEVTGVPFSLIFWDLDHFKAANDQFGHNIGDRALQMYSTLVQDGLGPLDEFGRWGGDEFIIVSRRPGREVQALALHLQEELKRQTFPEMGRLTASYGISSVQAGDTMESLIKRADLALYAVKTGDGAVGHSTKGFQP